MGVTRMVVLPVMGEGEGEGSGEGSGKGVDDVSF